MNSIGFACMIAASLTMTVNCGNILVVLPYPAPSHFHCFYPLLHELANRNHNITVLSPFTPDDTRINGISLAGVQKFFPPALASLREKTRFSLMLSLHELADTFVKGSFTHPSIQALIRDNSTHFDLVMIEYYYSELYLALGKKFKAPVIALVPQTLPANHGWRLSVPTSFSYIPMMYVPFSNVMSFIQRTINTIFGVAQILIYERAYMLGHQQSIDRNFHFLDTNEGDVYAMTKDIALTLINTHYSFSYPRPYPPNVIEVGGIHLKLTQKLPQDMQKFMEEATDGAVYISFGTMVDPAMVDSWGKVIVDVFGKTSLRVLWKWKPSLLKDIPERFMVKEWFPQNDILQHPNCKLFLTHGGIHSLIESVNAAVPILGFPFFSEQPYNVVVMEKLGIGLRLHNIEKNELQNAVQKIINDSKYQTNMKQRSKLFKNRITDPVSTAVYWVEHVMQNKGAPHLKTGAEQLSWYEYFLLDVFLFLFIVFVLLCTFARYGMKYVWRGIYLCTVSVHEFLTSFPLDEKKKN